MEEFKCRVWDKQKEQMFTEDISIYCAKTGFEGMGPKGSRKYYPAGIYVTFGWDWRGQMLPVPDRMVILWYTTFKDKHEREIYEGDIVIDWLGHSGGSLRGIIRFEGSAFIIDYNNPGLINTVLHSMRDRTSGLEIIGNIWEHPGLLIAAGPLKNPSLGKD